jgi:DNA primase
VIPNTFIQDLLNRVDVVEVVGRFVQLKKAGANYMGLCPFHGEKSPSFSVSPTKQFYHCFGCGAHGTAISFLMDHTGLSFPEAVEDLAQSMGMSVPHEAGRGPGGASGVAAAPATPLTAVMQQAADFYRRELRGAVQAIEYLKRRGLTGEIAARFGLGYAADGWQNLEQVFTDYRDDTLVQAGLVIVSDKTDPNGERRRYDRFRERIMFPIRNARGHTIGFGGRVLDTGEPKYLNSPETPLFSKGSELYGLFEARREIRDQGYALVVEGYMDVVALAQHGFGNAVATLGTACTPVHVQKLFRQTDTVVFSFDGDAAGRKAARRALEACLPHAADNRTVRFLFLPSEHDPDSFVREHGAKGFGCAVEQALPLSQFLINEALAGKTLDQPEGRARALFDARPMLQALPAGALRMQIAHMLADRLQMTMAEVASLADIPIGRGRARPGNAPARAERRRMLGNEQRALRNLLMYPRIVALLDEAEIETLTHATHNGELFAEVVGHARELGEDADFSTVSDLLRASQNAPTYEELFRDILVYDENVRDLVMYDPASAADAQRRHEQERLAGEELRAAILRLLYDAVREQCNQFLQRPRLTPEETSEYGKLMRQLVDLKKRLAA